MGEFWVKNECVSQGYWNNSQLSQEVFQAKTSDGRGPYLRTGDQGFRTKSGEVFFTSRLKGTNGRFSRQNV